MSVHYKFKSSLEYDTVTFDGLHISVADLKAAIFQQKRIGKTSDFDLQVTNAQTKEVYSDNNALIPKNTSLLVARVPLAQQPKKAWEGPGSGGPVQARTADGTSAAKGASDLSRMEGSEDDKIMAMMSQSTLDYDPSNYQKIRGANQRGDVPPTYLCRKCQQPGHWIKNCPLGDSAEPIDIKRSTGIPQSFMVPVEGPTAPGAMMTPNGEFAVPVVDHEAYKASDAGMETVTNETPRQEIPEDLLCSLCRDLLTDAVMIPCCGNSFCDECIRSALLESEDHECPDCRDKDISPGTLIPNRFLRNSVATFRNQTGYSPRPRLPSIQKAPPKVVVLEPQVTAEAPGLVEEKVPSPAAVNGPTPQPAKSEVQGAPARRASRELDIYEDSDGSYDDNITVKVPPLQPPPSHQLRQPPGGSYANNNGSNIKLPPHNTQPPSHHHNQPLNASYNDYVRQPRQSTPYGLTPHGHRVPLKPPGLDTPPNPHMGHMHMEERAGTPIVDEREPRHTGQPRLVSRPQHHLSQPLQGPDFEHPTGSYSGPNRPVIPQYNAYGVAVPVGPHMYGAPVIPFQPPYQPLPPGIREPAIQGPPGVVVDPLEAFERMIREKEERARMREKRSRTRSRSLTRSRSRSQSRSRFTRSRTRSRSRIRSRTPFSRSRSRSRPVSVRSPPLRRIPDKYPRSFSRSPPPPRRGLAGPPSRRRSRDRRSKSFSISRSRSRSRSITPRDGRPLGRFRSPARFRSPLRTLPPQGSPNRPRFMNAGAMSYPREVSREPRPLRSPPSGRPLPPSGPPRPFPSDAGPPGYPSRYNRSNGPTSALLPVPITPDIPRMRYVPPFEDVPPGTQPPPPGFEHSPIDRRDDLAPPGVSERERERDRPIPPFRDGPYREPRPPFREGRDGPPGIRDEPLGMRDGPPGIRDGPPGIRDGPPGVRDGPPGIRDGPPGIRDGPPGIRDGPPGIRDGPSGLRDGPPGVRDGPPGFRDGPPGIRDGPGFRDGPPGMRDGPPGIRDGLTVFRDNGPPGFRDLPPPGFRDPSGLRDGPPPSGFREGLPGGFRDGPPSGVFREGHPPLGFQDGQPPGFRDGPPPGGFRDGPPAGYREGPPGSYREGPPPLFRDGPPRFRDGPQGFRDGPPMRDGIPPYRDGPSNFRDGPGFRDNHAHGRDGPYMRDVQPHPRDGPPHSRDGQLHSRDGSQHPRDGIPHTRDGPPHPRDGPSHPRDGPPHPRDVPPHTRDGPPHVRDGPPHVRDGPPHIRDGPPHPRDGLPHHRDGPPHPRDGPPHSRDGLPLSRDGPPHSRDGPPHSREGPPHARDERFHHARDSSGQPRDGHSRGPYPHHDRQGRGHSRPDYARDRYREHRDHRDRDPDRTRDVDKRDREHDRNYEKTREERPRDYDKNREPEKDRDYATYYSPERRRRTISPKREPKEEKSKIRGGESRGRSKETDYRRDSKKEHDKGKIDEDKNKDKKIKEKKKKKKEKEFEKKKKKDKKDKKEKVEVPKDEESKATNDKETDQEESGTKRDQSTPHLETKSQGSPEKVIEDLYNDVLSEGIDRDIIETYGKDLDSENANNDDEKESSFDGLELRASDLDLKPDTIDISKDKSKNEMLAPIPELSKWEVDEDQISGNEPGEICSPNDKSGKVTSEVLKRAENAIFAKAINAIRPIEIKKISTDRAKLYSGDVVDLKTQTVDSDGKIVNNIQITIPTNMDHRSVEINEGKRSKQERTPPPKLSIKERLGGKVEEPSRRGREERLVQSTVERIKSRSRTPQMRHFEKESHRRITVEPPRDRSRRYVSKIEEVDMRNAGSDNRIPERRGHDRYEPQPGVYEKHRSRGDEEIRQLPRDDRKRDRRANKSSSPERKIKKKERKVHKKEKEEKKVKKEKREESKDRTPKKIQSSNESKDVKPDIKDVSATNEGEGKKSTLDEASFEPDYDEPVESETEVKDSETKKPSQAKTSESGDVGSSDTIHLDLSNVKKRSRSESSSSSSDLTSSSSSSGSKKRRRKKRKLKKKKTKHQSSDSGSESESSSDEPKKKKRKHKHKKKASKKKKKSKHK